MDVCRGVLIKFTGGDVSRMTLHNASTPLLLPPLASNFGLGNHHFAGFFDTIIIDIILNRRQH
jgi:hypothetical protein